MKYIPALKYHLLTPLYDAGIRLTMPEQRLKRRLLEIASIRNGIRALDIGCGTGTLLVLASRQTSGATLTGIDPDPTVLRRARRKLARAGASVRLEVASATALPFRSGSIDRVLSTLMFHHLDSEQKREALEEAFRVLRCGGEMHIADFGPPGGAMTRLASFLVEHVGHEHIQENIRGLIPLLMAGAGFESAGETWAVPTIFGMVRLYRGVKP